MSAFATKVALAILPLAASTTVAVYAAPAELTRSGWTTVKTEKCSAVVVEGDDKHCIVKVIKGSAIIRNSLDRSALKVSAGTVYESVAAGALQDPPSSGEVVALFQTRSNTSYLYGLEPSSKLKAQIIGPPANQSYEIGAAALQRFPIPRLLTQHFPPAGFFMWQPPAQSLATGAGSQ